MSPRTPAPADLVAAALREPSAWQSSVMPESRWSALFGQARTAGLLARVAWTLAEPRLDRAVDPDPQTLADSGPWPAGARPHVASAWRLAQAQRAEVRRELRHIAHALAILAEPQDGPPAPVVLLKGAAYVAADLPPSRRGRLFSDIDVLVPRRALDRAELNLELHGWQNQETSTYTQRYYRDWMHELPPMVHRGRGTAMDLHHALVPPTARIQSPAEPLFERAVALPASPGLMALSVLCMEDMLLHSSTHLVLGEDMRHALRDLSDIDLLWRHASATRPGFDVALADRAEALGLTRPLAYALLSARRVLGTPLPDRLAGTLAAALPGAPLRGLMRWLWTHAMRNRHPGATEAGTPWALAALYVRGHWLRMPLPMLARHLTIKALRLHESPEDPAKNAG
jgi:hypothetical protein